MVFAIPVGKALLAGVAVPVAIASALSGSAEGQWYFPRIEGFGASQVWSLTLEPDRLTMTNRCEYVGYSAQARVSARARIEPDSITVLEQKHQVVTLEPGRVECRVALDRGALRYRIEAGELVVTDPETGESATLTRDPPETR